MTSEQQIAKPTEKWIIALEYYDGPMSGVAYRTGDLDWVFFRVVGWDLEQWSKVYATTFISRESVNALLSALQNVEPIVKPLWIPSYTLEHAEVIEAWKFILAEAQKTSGWKLSETRDLLLDETELLDRKSVV